VSDQDVKPSRSWREIAAEVSIEQDPKRMLELIEELNSALESWPPRKPHEPAMKIENNKPGPQGSRLVK
jgi:hypothetical protein